MVPSDLTKQPGKGVIVSRELLEDLKHGRGLTDAAISARTRAAYTYEFGRFEKWAERHQLPHLPTPPAIVATYLAHLRTFRTITATICAA